MSFTMNQTKKEGIKSGLPAVFIDNDHFLKIILSKI